MHFLKEDLEGTHYNWNANPEKPLFLGEPTRRLFDPHNGHQVLFLINYFGSTTTDFSKATGKLIEDKIMNQLPLNAKSEISVYNWIVEKIADKTESTPIPLNS
jgi:hypothetical protein